MFLVWGGVGGEQTTARADAGPSASLRMTIFFGGVGGENRQRQRRTQVLWLRSGWLLEPRAWCGDGLDRDRAGAGAEDKVASAEDADAVAAHGEAGDACEHVLGEVGDDDHKDGAVGLEVDGGADHAFGGDVGGDGDGEEGKGRVADAAGQGVCDEEVEEDDGREEGEDAEPGGFVVEIADGAEGDACAVVVFLEEADFVGELVAEGEKGLVFPEEVGDDVAVRGPDGKESVLVALIGAGDESVVEGDHVEAVDEALRGAVEVGAGLVFAGLEIFEVGFARAEGVPEVLDGGLRALGLAGTGVPGAPAVLREGDEDELSQGEEDDERGDLLPGELVAVKDGSEQPGDERREDAFLGKIEQTIEEHETAGEPDDPVGAALAAAFGHLVDGGEDDGEARKVVELMEGAGDGAHLADEAGGHELDDSADEEAAQGGVAHGVDIEGWEQGSPGAETVTEGSGRAHDDHAGAVGEECLVGRVEIGFAGFAEEELPGEADDGGEERVEEDVGARRVADSAGCVVGEGGEHNKGGGKEGEGGVGVLKLLEEEDEGREDQDRFEAYPVCKGDDHRQAQVYPRDAGGET